MLKRFVLASLALAATLGASATVFASPAQAADIPVTVNCAAAGAPVYSVNNVGAAVGDTITVTKLNTSAGVQVASATGVTYSGGYKLIRARSSPSRAPRAAPSGSRGTPSLLAWATWDSSHLLLLRLLPRGPRGPRNPRRLPLSFNSLASLPRPHATKSLLLP